MSVKCGDKLWQQRDTHQGGGHLQQLVTHTHTHKIHTLGRQCCPQKHEQSAITSTAAHISGSQNSLCVSFVPRISKSWSSDISAETKNKCQSSLLFQKGARWYISSLDPSISSLLHLCIILCRQENITSSLLSVTVHSEACWGYRSSCLGW